MNRRDFIKAFAGGIATVAIGMRVAQGIPKVLADGYEYKTISMGFSITREEVEGKGIYGAIGRRYADALAKSMSQTRERVGANVMTRAFSP